jgi:hypothetical protein
MADEFDTFLKQALAPPAEADRVFVARMQAHIRLEERLASERRIMVSKLWKELVALLAIAGALVWLSRSPAVAEWAASAPALAVAILLLAFCFVVTIFSGGSGARSLA